MRMTLDPFRLLLISLAGWINQQQQDVIEYLRDENHVYEQLGNKRPRLNDDQRRRLAVRLLHKVAPHYPEKAMQLGVEGTVVMCATIGKDGKIKTLKPISGPQELVPAALKAVKKWRYAPIQLDGETVEVETDIRVNFQLKP